MELTFEKGSPLILFRVRVWSVITLGFAEIYFVGTGVLVHIEAGVRVGDGLAFLCGGIGGFMAF